MKILRVIGSVVGVVVVVAGLAWLFRGDPMGPVAGRQLSGAEFAYPADWGFTDEHFTIAVESRPEDPHSVTTICFVHEGDLYVPAQSGTEKKWTHYVVEDPRVRLKVGDRVYPASAVRVTDLEPRAVLASAAKKYERMAERMDEDPPGDIWLFRIGPRKG